MTKVFVTLPLPSCSSFFLCSQTVSHHLGNENKKINIKKQAFAFNFCLNFAFSLTSHFF